MNEKKKRNRDLLVEKNTTLQQLKLLSFTQQSGAEQFWVSVHPNVSICAVHNSRWQRGSGNAPHRARKQGPSDGFPFDNRKSHQEKPACTVASLLFCLSPQSLGGVFGSLKGLLLQGRQLPPSSQEFMAPQKASLLTLTLPMRPRKPHLNSHPPLLS